MTAGINPVPARSGMASILSSNPNRGDIAFNSLSGKAGIAADGPETAFWARFRAVFGLPPRLVGNRLTAPREHAR
jgi:hypothetical protein